MNWAQVLQLLKQYGPVVGLLLLLVYWLTRRIDKLLDRNAEIYEAHVKQLTETQKWLLTRLIGPQPSSAELPTVQQLKDAVGKQKLGQPQEEASKQEDKK